MGKLIELICTDMSEQDNIDRSEVKRTMDTATGHRNCTHTATAHHTTPHHNRTHHNRT